MPVGHVQGIFPHGRTVTEIGLVPAANGDPKATVKVPVVPSIASPDTVLALKFVDVEKVSGGIHRQRNWTGCPP